MVVGTFIAPGLSPTPPRSLDRWNSFVKFTRLQLESEDIDPVYPVLRHRIRDMSKQTGLWYTICYLAWYSLASAEEAFQAAPPGSVPALPVARRPTGFERRNLRGGTNMIRHFESLLKLVNAAGGPYQFFTQGFVGDPRRDYLTLRERTLPSVWGNARWAAYKAAEVLEKVNGLDIRATDMGNRNSSGPRQGLAVLYPGLTITDEQVDLARADLLGSNIQSDLLRPSTENQPALDLGIDQVETMLCNFHALSEGNYYSGFDIDEMLEGLLEAEDESLMMPLWESRAVALPGFTLGEANGWRGIDKERKKAYSEHRALLRRDEPWP